nr:helix-turn-helix transcriptional regulator [Micromonospora sp. DSM 115978]
MRGVIWLRSPSVRHGLLVAAVLGGCFIWAMIFVGLSFAMAERGNPQWWLMPAFGVAVLGMALLAMRALRGHPATPTASPAVAQVTPVARLLPVAPVAAAAVTPAAAVAAVAARFGPGGVGRELPEPLSPREVEVLWQLAAGRSNKEIAKALFVAPGTVKAHLNHIFRKLDAASRLQAVAHARAAGLLDPPPETTVE